MSELVIVSGRDPFTTFGGSESFAVATAACAKLAGYEPHLFTLVRGGRRETLETAFGTVHRAGTPLPVRSIWSLAHRPLIVAEIVRFLQDRPGPHVLHALGTWADAAVAASRALRRRGIEAIPITSAFTTMTHEARPKLEDEVVRADPRLRLAMLGEVAWARSVSTVQERETYRRCRVVLVNYESVRRILDEAYAGLEIRRVTYSPGTAFEPPAPDPGPPAVPGDPDAPLILSISRHDGRKGLDVLLHALARLRDRGIAFRACLTSSGGLLEAHRELAAQLGLGERVSFPGRVASQLDYLRHCDIFALPSREEGSGSVSVLEALQAGAAIVSSDVDGMPEDLTHEHDALLVPPGDADALADALARLLADPQLRERLGAAGRVTYEERFTPERTARDLAAIYTELGLRPAS